MFCMLKHKRISRRIWKNIFLEKNTEKYLTFTVPIEKEVTRINKNGEKTTKNISYILKFIDSARFMASLSSTLANNLPKGIDKIICA